MKKLFILIIAVSWMFSGCSTKYDTIPNKDISVKVRSIWADVDYDSRVCPEELEPLEPLEALDGGIIEPLEPIE